MQFTDKKLHETINKINALNPLLRMVAYLALGTTVACTISLATHVIAYALGSILLVSVVAVRLLLGEDAAVIIQEFSTRSDDTPSDRILDVLVPVVEEVVFRGILQPVTKISVSFVGGYIFDKDTAKKVAKVTSIVFTSVAFGLIHFPNEKHRYLALPQVSLCIISGLIQGHIREESGSLWPCIGEHIAWNALVTTNIGASFFKPIFVTRAFFLNLLLNSCKSIQ